MYVSVSVCFCAICKICKILVYMYLYVVNDSITCIIIIILRLFGTIDIS